MLTACDEISRIALAAPDMARHLLALLPPDTTAGLDTRRLRRQPAEQAGDRPWRLLGLWQLTAPAPAGLRRWQPDLEMGCATFGGEGARPAPSLLRRRLAC